MLEGYIISWSTLDPVTGDEVINTMTLQEVWDQIQDTTIQYDDLGFHLADGTSLSVDPPAPEPYQGMTEADLIVMLNNFLTSSPNIEDEIGDEDEQEEVFEVIQTTNTKKNSTMPSGSTRVFLGSVCFIVLIVLLGDKK